MSTPVSAEEPTAAQKWADLPIGAWGYPQVQGYCPSCHLHSLFLASGGYVTCANIPCSNPTVVSDLLGRGDERA